MIILKAVKKSRDRQAVGFTLVEVLVVIVILSILTGLLLPVFSRAKVNGKKAVAISNAGQLSKSILIYSGDFDDVAPSYCARCICASCSNLIVDGPEIWYTLILPYTGHSGKKGSGQWGMYLPQDLPDIYFDPNESKVSLNPLNDTCQPFGAYGAWGINDFIVNKVGTVTKPGDGKAISFSAIGDSSKIVLIAETLDYACGGRVMGVALAVPYAQLDGFDGHSGNETLDGFYGSSENVISSSTARSGWGLNIVAKVDGSVKLIHRSMLIDDIGNWKP